MELPVEFINRMQTLLGVEADAFFQSCQQPNAYGLRINPLKYSTHFSEKDFPFTLTPVAWAKEGFYAASEEHPGKHPLHEGGAYYIQEPSAMSVASLLAPEPGDKVCDLCAAPGGKSTQIAGRLYGKGLLVSNEIFLTRAKILSQNIERFGVGNCVVCNEPPDKMAKHFPLFFDKIVVDAPCSGEGMFRKDENAIKEWSVPHVNMCRERQKMILEYADQMLALEGVMVYSTCTFAPEENEQMVAWFLRTHPDYILEDWKKILPENCGLEGGRIDFLDKNTASDDSVTASISNTLRLWPHKIQGEGHFAARLRKKGSIQIRGNVSEPSMPPLCSAARKKPPKRNTDRKTDISEYLLFKEQFLNSQNKNGTYTITEVLSDSDNYQYFGDELYLVPAPMNSLQGLKVLRAGLHLGTRKKNRFEPAHALAMALHPDDAVQCVECTEEEAICYLKGDTISCDSRLRSWTLVCHRGISLGWGKASNGTLKNHYPKGLRVKCPAAGYGA